MAAMRSKGTAPYVSGEWVQNEMEQSAGFVAQEVEEFGYSVRNELEWLNEHMADVFSKSQVNFADILKTPGKLRGKTPRTARKVDPLAPRQPLTDIFSSDVQAAPPSGQKNAFFDKVARIRIAQDENQSPQPKPVSRGTSPQRAGKPYTDSGYHGMMTEDEMEVDAQTLPNSLDTSYDASEPQKVPVSIDQPPQRVQNGKDDETGTSEDSFVSAKEQESQGTGEAITGNVEVKDAAAPAKVVQVNEDGMSQANENAQILAEEPIAQVADNAKVQEPEQEHDMEIDGEESAQSDGSSPAKPLQRKSSFTFSSLPAREPFVAKKSMGPIDHHRSSVFGKSFNKGSQNDADESSQEKPAEMRVHSKSSAQLLHERLNMLGKTKEPRPSKSIPQSAVVVQPSYPQLPDVERLDSRTTEGNGHPGQAADTIDAHDETDGDWIAPTKPVAAAQRAIQQADSHDSPARPLMHQKSISTTDIPSPARPEMATENRHQKSVSVSQPNLREHIDSTTPIGSPRKNNDGPLSASKNRLWSALKSAKSIFASSASASAAAKLEAHKSQMLNQSSKAEPSDAMITNMPGALYPQRELWSNLASNHSVISLSPSRKTRNSGESERKREKEVKAQQKAEEELQKAREKERQKALKQQAEERAKAEKAAEAGAAKLAKEKKQNVVERPVSAESDHPLEDNETGPPVPPKNVTLGSAKLRAPGRLGRPTRNEPAPPKPAPVAIKVASQSQRLGQSTSQPSLSKSHGTNPAPVQSAKDTKPRPSSAMGNRAASAALSNSRVKALEAAARKKEADEKVAAKKAEQKRELERKRAEKAEQERRAEEERKIAEQQRVQEAKLAIQRKAAEKQAAEARKRELERQEQQRRDMERQEQLRLEQERLEQQRRELELLEQQRREAEQLRQQEDARKAREAHELAEAIRRERAQQGQIPNRGDVQGTLRQLTKGLMPVNPAKPAKRQLPAEEDEPVQQPQRPALARGPASYQQTDAKRRRTNEEQEEQSERRSVMAPPKRPSTLRKETMSKFTHGYTHVAPPTQHQAMFKAGTNTQHHAQHGSKPTHPSQLVQTSSARIPFAENSNPPAAYHSTNTAVHSGYENVNPKFKTPARPAYAPVKSAKSTPQYHQSDNIELPDIATDSEDESDESDSGGGGGGFRAPSWVASPALRDLLTQQQLVDPETVFGPIGELKMDEVFKNSKNQERLRRFRDRGSSALWTETGDAVTSAEKRKDMEMRERVARDGGWRYEPRS